MNIEVRVWVDGEEIDLSPTVKAALSRAAKREKKSVSTPHRTETGAEA